MVSLLTKFISHFDSQTNSTRNNLTLHTREQVRERERERERESEMYRNAEHGNSAHEEFVCLGESDSSRSSKNAVHSLLLHYLHERKQVHEFNWKQRGAELRAENTTSRRRTTTTTTIRTRTRTKQGRRKCAR